MRNHAQSGFITNRRESRGYPQIKGSVADLGNTRYIKETFYAFITLRITRTRIFIQECFIQDALTLPSVTICPKNISK